ncbi:dienelactone hydrolase family protein [Blastochloris tepida]|uniref:Uncharacterized protein n=1 Tax=Blastochloris tepida TaxID=2233851 RepID=A0A348FXD3_9HYPH|nr:dienelactone hydrolase family protein [Blastochloris tepida]BBF91966.1 hypothetical protein BLTE_06510 [Blastochloris tepida]
MGTVSASAMSGRHPRAAIAGEVRVGALGLPGDLTVPAAAGALVVFAHGSGSSRLSPRNRTVAEALNRAGIGTLLFDLLTVAEEQDRANVFDIPLLAERLVDAVRWLDLQPELNQMQPELNQMQPELNQMQPELNQMPLGLFGASTGAAAALVAAAALGTRVGAVVSRGGRPDLAGAALPKVRAPTLLIVGGDDFGVIELNQDAFDRLTAPKDLAIIPGATHLFPESGAMEAVIELALGWFERFLVAPARGGAG